MFALVVASMLSQIAPWGAGESRGEDLTIWLTTFGAGESIDGWWGHSALVVEDKRLAQHRLYSYGIANFSAEFVGQFVDGRMKFWVDDTELVRETYDQYRQANRDVRTQQLNLTPGQRLVLAKSLADNVLPQNREFLYRHYDDNCTTRPRDLIDKALGGQLFAATAGPARLTLRQHTRRYSRVNPVMSLVLDCLQNDLIDRPITQREEAFLPDELERQLNALTLKQPDGSLQPAVVGQGNYFVSPTQPRAPAESPDWNLELFLVGCGLGGVGLLLGRWGRGGRRAPRMVWGLYNAVLGLAWGSLGLFATYLAFFTQHQVTPHNENLFLFNPLTFALLPLGVMRGFGSRKAEVGLRWTWLALLGLGVLGVVLKVLPRFDQANWNLILLVLPATAAMAATTWLERKRG